VLLILSDVLLLNTEESGILIYFTGQYALLGLSFETGRDILKESEIGLQLLNQLVSIAKGGCSLLDSLELSETIGNSIDDR
jgi:hypothetical protein